MQRKKKRKERERHEGGLYMLWINRGTMVDWDKVLSDLGRGSWKK